MAKGKIEFKRIKSKSGPDLDVTVWDNALERGASMSWDEFLEEGLLAVGNPALILTKAQLKKELNTAFDELITKMKLKLAEIV